MKETEEYLRRRRNRNAIEDGDFAINEGLERIKERDGEEKRRGGWIGDEVSPQSRSAIQKRRRDKISDSLFL